MTTITETPQVAKLLQLADERPEPKWCDHKVCAAFEDIDQVSRLHSITFWQSGDGHRCVEITRTAVHQVDGVIQGDLDFFADVPRPEEECEWRDGLRNAFAFALKLGRGQHG
jgi:hypothetical protein